MQIVHFSTKYGSYDEAVSREDGLAIFVFLFKVSFGVIILIILLIIIIVIIITK